MNTVAAVKCACIALDEHLGEELSVLHIGKITTIAEYFVIVTAKNENQMAALQDAVDEALGREGLFPKRVEGGKDSPWILLDYGDFVVHIFSREHREFYNLERLWADGEEVDYRSLS